MSIRLKMMFMVSAAALIFFAAATAAGYFYTLGWLRHTAGEDYEEMARLMASSIAGIVDSQAELAKVGASDEILRNAVQESNLKYPADADAVKNYLVEMDKKWAGDPNGAMAKEYLNNNPGFIARSFMAEAEKITGILITDKYGGLVGSAGAAPKFYYGDDAWWQAAFDAGKGKIFAGDPVFNEETGTWRIPLAVPVKSGAGDVIGIYRMDVDINRFFGPLQKFKAGRTGGAALVDDKGYLIFGFGVSPFSGKFCADKELQKALHSRRKQCVMNSVYLHDRGAFTAFARIEHPLFGEKGVNWYVFVVQDMKEVFGSLGAFLGQMGLTAVILLAILAAAGFALGAFLARPAEKLREGMKNIGRGNLEEKIEISTGDEFEALALSANAMAEGLKKITVPASKFDEEAAERRNAEKRASEAREDFILSASKLRPIVSMAEREIKGAAAEPAAGEKQKKMISAALGYIEMLDRSMDGLIDAAKMEAGKIELKKTEVSMKTLLKNIVFVFEPKIRAKGLDFKIDVPKEPLNVYADSDKMAQVFAGLLGNAVKNTEKGHIGILLKELQSDIECKVVDTGKGIPKEEIPAVFEKFRHFGGEETQDEPSTGLELAMAKAIIELHGGKIWAESERGKGTKFTFRLPKHASQANV